MARSFTRQGAKQLIQFFKRASADADREYTALAGLWESLPELVKGAVDKKALDSVENEFVDVLVHEGGKELARRLSAEGCKTLGDARRHYSNPTSAERNSRRHREDVSLFEGVCQRMIDFMASTICLALDEDARTPQSNDLLLSSYRYLASLPFVNECLETTRLYQVEIERALRDLAPGARNSLAWLFVSREEKDAAERAFDHLTSIKDGDYGSRMGKSLKMLQKIRETNEGGAWAEYRRSPDKFIALLDEAAPGKVFRSSVSPEGQEPRPFPSGEVRKLANSSRTLIKDLSTVATFSDRQSLQAQIEVAADKFVAEESLALLRDIPIEELNRERKGIRVGVLRDAGYKSIADLAAASVYELASIRGISEDSAHTIKREYKVLSKRVHGTTKIRLSTDRKTKAASNLATATYKFIRKRELGRKCADFLDIYSDRIDQAAEAIRRSCGDVGWLLASAYERDLAVEEYGVLEEFFSGPFIAEANAAIKAFKELGRDDEAAAWKDFEQRPVEYINALEDIVPNLVGSGGVYGLPEDLAREIEDECFFPEGLLCQLRRYQEWGVKYTLHQERVLLGDEMGLGKTVQAIAAMVSLRNTGETHFIVVCPASVLSNWCREIKKMSLLRPIKVHGTGRDSALKHWINAGGVAVTTYETTGRLEMPEGFKFGMLVVDEAHYVKNPKARRSINVKELCESTGRLLFMTGTALENKVDEMIELIDVLQPKVAVKVRPLAALSQAPLFQQEVAPVYYRRKREDVLTELPDLEETEAWCELGPYEEQYYERAVLGRSFQEARRVSWNIDDISKSSKANRLREIVEEAEGEGRKILVFTYFLDTIRKVVETLGDRCVNPINGSVSPQRRQEIIDEFDTSPAGAVLVAQIQSGGTGLNIQSASVVVICEPQLKPSIENQAISRAYRMGQTRKVLVYRLLCEDTIDERITDLLAEKQRIFDAFADKSVAAKESIELDSKTMGKLIDEEIERINEKKGRPNLETRTASVSDSSSLEGGGGVSEPSAASSFSNISTGSSLASRDALSTSKPSLSGSAASTAVTITANVFSSGNRPSEKAADPAPLIFSSGSKSGMVSPVPVPAASLTPQTLTPKDFIMPKGSQTGNIYVYDGAPLAGIRDGEEFVAGTILTPMTMTSVATGTVFEGDEGSICFTYGGKPVGFLGTKRSAQLLDVAKRHDGHVSFWCRRDGDYMPGIPKLLPLFPDDAWFYADEEGIIVEDGDSCNSISIADYYWLQRAPNPGNGERRRIDLSISMDGDDVAARDGTSLIALITDPGPAMSVLELFVDAYIRAAWIDVAEMRDGYKRRRLCFITGE